MDGTVRHLLVSSLHLPLALLMALIDPVPVVGPTLAAWLAHPVTWITQVILQISWFGAAHCAYPEVCRPPFLILASYYAGWLMAVARYREALLRAARQAKPKA